MFTYGELVTLSVVTDAIATSPKKWNINDSVRGGLVVDIY